MADESITLMPGEVAKRLRIFCNAYHQLLRNVIGREHHTFILSQYDRQRGTGREGAIYLDEVLTWLVEEFGLECPACAKKTLLPTQDYHGYDANEFPVDVTTYECLACEHQETY